MPCWLAITLPGRTVTDSPTFHLVQIGSDTALLKPGADEPIQRQLRYVEILGRHFPNPHVTIIVFGKCDEPGRVVERPEGLTIVHVKGGRILSRLKSLPVLLRIHRDMPISVITTQTVHDEAWIALIAGRIIGSRVVGQIHYDIFSDLAARDVLGAGVLGGIRRRIMLAMLPRFHALRAVGSRMKAEIERRGMHGRVSLIPVPVFMVGKPQGSAETGRGPGTPRMLFVGRLVPQKNMFQWLDVAKMVADRVRDAEFDVVGDGPLRRDLEAKARDLGLADRVKFRGWVRNDELPAFYRESSLLLLTSLYEGFGRVVLEAYAAGVPVVGTRIAGLEDVVAHGKTGFLHDLGDLAGLADSVVRILSDPALGRRLGEQGRAMAAERFDPGRLAEEWMAMLAGAWGYCKK